MSKPIATFDFQTWNNQDHSGSSDSYNTAQGRNSLNANDNSLLTSPGTWVIIFDEEDYKGNCKKINPDVYLDQLSKEPKYNNDGTDDGDWKGNIQSFILYKQKPTYWDNGQSYTHPAKSDLLSLHDGQAVMAENDDFLGANRTFAAPYNGSSLTNMGYTTDSKQMSGTTSISSLKTGPNAWLTIFDDGDAKGNFKKVGPGTTENKLQDWTQVDYNNKADGTWENAMDSFLLYPAKPRFWDTAYPRPYVDFSTLFGLYPSTTNKVSDDKVEYVVEDSTYKIQDPEFMNQSSMQILWPTAIDITDDLPTDGWTKYHIYQQHDNTGSWDDTAEYDAYFDNTGKLVSIQRFEWSSKGAFNVPQTVIKSVDFIAWYIGTAASLISAGAAEEIADTFVEIFNFVCNVFNKIGNAIYKATDNGGQFYFLPVICHTLNRVCTTVLKPYNYPSFADPNDPRNHYKMSFSNTNFPGALNSALSGNGTANNWTQKDSATNKNSTFNQVSEFTYSNYHYRTWYQENSISAELGMFVSCKIDYEIGDNSKDDHIILLMGYAIPASGHTPVLSFAQVIVQFTDKSNTNIQGEAKNTDVINSVYNDLKSKLSGISMGGNGGRAYVAEITRANMNAINSCMSFQ